MRLYGQVGSEVGHGSEGMAAGRREVDVVIADDRDNLGNANLVAVISEGSSTTARTGRYRRREWRKLPLIPCFALMNTSSMTAIIRHTLGQC